MRTSCMLKLLPGKLVRLLQKHKGIYSFGKAMVCHPRRTGAILPSSKRLAKTMVAQVHLPPDKIVIELGPGTGVITEELIVSGISPSQIIAIEYQTEFAEALKQRFPDVKVIE